MRPKFILQSMVEILRFIIAEWGTKAQTNFFIPSEQLAGYSYLFDDNRNNHTVHTTNFHGHYHPTAIFVHADEMNNLHPHHYDVYMTTHHEDSSFSLTRLHYNSLQARFINLQSRKYIPQIEQRFEYAQETTIPYIHPQLNIPVPPLQLPWYFGALCCSYALAGAIMLTLPPPWTTQRWGHSAVGNYVIKEQRKKHWFPYRSFAWILILGQTPCSFLADYVNMTNISSWHVIDRCLACILMSMELVRIVVARPYTRPLIYILYLSCCGAAIFCFLKSQESQNSLNADGFVFWHNCWHCYPLAGSFIQLLDLAWDRRMGHNSC